MDDDNDGVRLVPVPSSSRISGTKPPVHRKIGINISDMVLSLPGAPNPRSNPASGTMQKKPQGTPISIPMNERRPSSLSKGSTHNTLMTGIRDGGPGSRRKSATTTIHGGFSPPFSPKSVPAPDDYDVVGFVEGYPKRGSSGGGADMDRLSKLTKLERLMTGKSKERAAEVVLLSDEDDHHDSKMIKRRKMSQESPFLGPSQAHPITVKYKVKSLQPTATRSPPASKSAQSQSPSTPPPSNRVRFLPTTSSPITPEKMSAMGTGTYPHAQLLGIHFNNGAEFHSPDMRLQFAPERLVFIIDKVMTRIPHSDLKTIEFNTMSDIKVLLIDTKGPLDPSSNLAPHYNPEPHSGRSRQMAVFCKMEPTQLIRVLKELHPKGVSLKPMASDKARKAIDDFKKQAETEKEDQVTKTGDAKVESETSSIPSPSRITRSLRRFGQSKTDALLFTYPICGGPKSITIHESDVVRLEPEQFLNDTVIEFGLKFMQEELESVNPDLAKRIHVFNSFFYERLSEKDGSSPISYNKIKKWTSKVDLFEKKYILVPIHESAHWYLAIITNPGLLMKQEENTGRASTADADTPKETSSLPTSPADSPMDSTEANVSGDRSPQKLPAYGTRNLSKPEVDPSVKPYIIVLDSLDLRHPTIFNNLRSYLQHELEAKKGISIKVSNAEMVGKYAKWPRQGNHCDCGVFLLHYAKTFLKDPEKMLWSIVNSVNNENMWSDDEITKLRDRYKEDMLLTKVRYDAYQIEKQSIHPSTTTSIGTTALRTAHSVTKPQPSSSSTSASPAASSASSTFTESHSRTPSSHRHSLYHNSNESGEDLPLDPCADTAKRESQLSDASGIGPMEVRVEDKEQEGSDKKTKATHWQKSGASIEL